jgi:type IV secretory pathway protease TraF
MQIDQLHITHIYQGLLACSNIRKFNERYLSAIEEHARVYLSNHIPLHVTLPSSVPDTLPRYMVTILLNGTPVGRENECDENGEPYHGHWLGVVQFIDSPTSHEVDLALQNAKTAFDIHSKGYFF